MENREAPLVSKRGTNFHIECRAAFTLRQDNVEICASASRLSDWIGWPLSAVVSLLVLASVCDLHLHIRGLEDLKGEIAIDLRLTGWESHRLKNEVFMDVATYWTQASRRHHQHQRKSLFIRRSMNYSSYIPSTRSFCILVIDVHVQQCLPCIDNWYHCATANCFAN